MYGWIFKRIGWKFFAAGAATAVVGSNLVRPALVTVVKAGMGAQKMASDVWEQAKEETTSIISEAGKIRSDSTSASDVMAELRRLREDVASLKTQVASKVS
jgi:hypothetical protein